MQTLMSVGAVSASTATDLFNDCLSKSGSTYRVDTDDLGDAVESLNNSLRAFDFQVDATVCSDGDVWWGFVNTARDDAAKLACAFTSTQLALFQAITDAIKTSDHGKIGIAAATNMVSQLGEGSRMRVLEGSKTIQKLAQLQWLSIDKDEDRNTQAVVFGPRAYLELPDVRSWARQRANGLSGDIDEDEDEDTQGNGDIDLDINEDEDQVLDEGDADEGDGIEDEEDETTLNNIRKSTVFVPDEEEEQPAPRRRKRKKVKTQDEIDEASQPTSRRSTRSSQRSQSTQESPLKRPRRSRRR